MQSLRNAVKLARLVLAWFALSLGVAVAAPLVQPQSIELVCSGGGTMKLLVKDADGNSAGTPQTLECPMCASVDEPPVLSFDMQAPQPLAHVVSSIPAARIAGLTGAPLPARGPPALS